MYGLVIFNISVPILQVQLKSGEFSRGGILKVGNTLKVTRGYYFQHIEVISTASPKRTTSWKVTQTLKSVENLMCSQSKEVKDNSKRCCLCKKRPVVKLSVAAEAAFYRKYLVSNKVAQAYKRLTKGLGADCFQPFHKVYEQQRKLKETNFETGLVELNKSKKIENCNDGPAQKITVPYLCVSSLPRAVLHKLLQSDKEFSYFRHNYQKHDEWEVLFGGDSGAESTKFGFFNTRQEKFNTGQNFCVAHMVEKVPDTPENMRICYENHISPEFVKLQSTSILRIRSKREGKVAGALIESRFPFLIPTVFMNWDICDDTNESDDDEGPNCSESAADESAIREQGANFESEFGSSTAPSQLLQTESSEGKINHAAPMEECQYLMDIAVELENELLSPSVSHCQLMEDLAEDCQAEIISDSPSIAENENADIKEGACSTAENVTDHNLRGKNEKVDIQEGGCSTAENMTDITISEGEIMLVSFESFQVISHTSKNCIRR